MAAALPVTPPVDDEGLGDAVVNRTGFDRDPKVPAGPASRANSTQSSKPACCSESITCAMPIRSAGSSISPLEAVLTGLEGVQQHVKLAQEIPPRTVEGNNWA